PEAQTPAVYAAGMAHLRSSNTVDRYGNQLGSTSFGCVGGPACASLVAPDEAISQVSVPTLLEHASGWMWRTTESFVVGSAQTAARKHTRTTFDELGRPVQVEAFLDGAEPLHRSEVASLPSGGAPSGWFVQSSTAYDALGNALRTRAANGRCAEVAYAGDAYALFPSAESIFTADTGDVAEPATSCSGPALITSASYDLGFGVVLTALDLNL